MTGIAKKCRCKKEQFWIDGRFITEYEKESTAYGRKFIWTDGTKWQYDIWDPNTSSRGPCNKTEGSCMGEPQNVPFGGQCLHAGVMQISQVDPKTIKNSRSRSAAITTPLPNRCYTWGNQFECTDRLPFVCKYPVSVIQIHV